MVSFRQITKSDWEPGDYRAVAEIHRKTEDFLHYNEFVFEKHMIEGLGRAKSAMFVTSNRKQFGMTEHLDTKIPITEIFILYKSETMSADLKEVLAALALTQSDLDWISDEISFD